MLTVGSLFSGIGGFDLGLERAGMRTLWFCEQDPFCQRVLARHWPGVPCHDDVRALVADAARDAAPGIQAATGAERERAGAGDQPGGEGRAVPVPVPPVDVLCGGFPCQDLSYAGKGAGLAGERSGLWSEYARLIGELRPRYVVVENVSALLARGLGVVLGDLAALGYDAEWDCLPAAAFGAPHRRDRIWLVAYPQSTGREACDGHGIRVESPPVAGPTACEAGALAYSHGAGSQGHGRPIERAGELAAAQGGAAGGARGLADSNREGSAHLREGQARGEVGRRDGWRDAVGDGGLAGWAPSEWWATEPDVGRVAHGIPDRVDRLRSLGNALVPQIAEWLGRRIIEWERGLT